MTFLKNDILFLRCQNIITLNCILKESCKFSAKSGDEEPKGEIEI